MLASLYLQVIGPMGTTRPGATCFVLRDADLAPYLITNRHVVTGQNTLNGLKVPADTLPVSAWVAGAQGRSSRHVDARRAAPRR